MKSSDIVISGKVIDLKSKIGIPGLKIEAREKIRLRDVFLNHQMTGERGEFQMEIRENKIIKKIVDQNPDLYFNIFFNDEIIHTTRDQKWKDYGSPAKELIISIDWQSEQKYSISGRVKTEKNIPAPGFMVRAYDIKIGKQLYLGEAITDDKGQYNIDYSHIIFKYPKGQAIDLQTKVFKNAMTKVELGKSNIILNAKRSEWINLTIPANAYRGASEFEQMEKEIIKLIKPAAYSKLKEKDIDYMSVKLNISTIRLEHYFHAWKLSNEANEFKQIQGIPTAIFYGVFKDDEFPNLEALVQKEKKSLSRNLHIAVNSNRIPKKLESQIYVYVDTLKDLAVLLALKGSKNTDLYSIKGLLRFWKIFLKNLKIRLFTLLFFSLPVLRVVLKN